MNNTSDNRIPKLEKHRHLVFRSEKRLHILFIKKYTILKSDKGYAFIGKRTPFSIKVVPIAYIYELGYLKCRIKQIYYYNLADPNLWLKQAIYLVGLYTIYISGKLQNMLIYGKTLLCFIKCYFILEDFLVKANQYFINRGIKTQRTYKTK